MKYFSPSYWFKMWVLSAPLFNDKTQGINAKSIGNKKIKYWASKNTTNISFLENQELTLSNNQTSLLNLPLWNTNLTTHNEHHKHRHQKSRRIKKQVTPNPRPSKEIFKLNQKLIINENNRIEYQTSFQTIINELVDRGVLTRIRDLNVLVNADFICEDNTILALNPESNYGYFRLPVAIRWQQNTQSIENNLELVLRTDNLYLQGFIVNNNYYHFDFRNINMNMQPQAVRDGSIPLLERIKGIQNNIVLNGISPDYRDMIRENDENIYWSNIFGSFFQLINRMDDNFNEQGILIEGALGNLARSLGDVILVTAESLRFWSLHTHIIQQLVNNNQYITLGRNNRNPIYNTLVNWSEESRTQSLIIDLLSTPNDRRPNPNSNQESRNILTEFGYLIRRDDEHFVNFLSRILILPINQLTNILGHSNIRIILSYFIKRNLDNCNRRQARQIINNNYWHEKFCDLKPQIDKIQGKINVIKVLDENTKGENLKEGDIYVETTESFYLIHDNGKVDKFFPEKTLHWRDDKEIFELKNDWWNWEKKYWTKNFKMGWIDPKNYNRIEFLGDTSGSRISWGGTAYYADKFNKLEKADLSYYIKENEGICDKNNYWGLKVWFKVQELKEWWESAWIEGEQTFVFCSYKENDDYYLKIVIVQVATCHASSIGGSLFLELGRGVRLYNDDNKLETQISNPNDRKRREIFEEKNELQNTTQWDKNITNFINHEQHLLIDNKTNFVTNNITSL